MKLHSYARARAAYTEAEEILVRTEVPEALWPQHQLRRILAELLEDAAAVDRAADLLWGTLKAGRMAEHSGVRFLLAQDGRLLLENASRAHGSPEAATPSCIACGGLTGDILCEACVDLHRPAGSPEERAHRERVRAYLAKETGASTEPTWAFLLNVVASHRPDLAQLLSRATPLRLHRSGYFCATADSDETCQALMRASREVELLLVEHRVPALGYRMGVGWEPGVGKPVPLLTCDILHLP
ncbi:hypothetical protein [Archangium lansingense]|uniref:Uncharacterized protein n=1 Tax=Archangium lansingense TaxID=2995310 RepID=A0ABT4AQ85_9BACT|nr:hypothetical protein [Archangium lansinium]MCY1083786.1 hypothetical protein [Archangium lansinium]